MKSILGNFIDEELLKKAITDTDESCRELENEINKAYDMLSEQLTEEQKCLLDTMHDAMLVLRAEHGRLLYKEGFKQGVLVAFDVMEE